MKAALLDPVIDALGSDTFPGIDPKRLACLLGMAQNELAALARIHRTTLARNPSSSDVQVKLGEIATIVARAADMASNPNKAVLWFRHQAVPAFGFRRAADLVQEGDAKAVLAWLNALEDGAYG